MTSEKYYCGNCGSALYFGTKFKEHSLVRPCPACQRMNPLYFHYCYRCGTRLSPAADEAPDDTA